MRGAKDRLVLLVVDALDDVCLLAHSGIGKNRVSSSQIFQVRLKRTDVNRRPVRNILSKAERVGDLLHRVESSELPDAHAHGVARMDETV